MTPRELLECIRSMDADERRELVSLLPGVVVYDASMLPVAAEVQRVLASLASSNGVVHAGPGDPSWAKAIEYPHGVSSGP